MLLLFDLEISEITRSEKRKLPMKVGHFLVIPQPFTEGFHKLFPDAFYATCKHLPFKL